MHEHILKSGKVYLWIAFTGILFLPFFSYLFPFIDRSILNIVSVSLSLIIASFINKPVWSSYFNVLVLIGAILVLFIQLAKTSLTFGMYDGFASFLRYALYVIMILQFRKTGVGRLEFKVFLFVSCALAALSIFIGLVSDQYIFLNGQDRFMGSSHSPAALSMQLAVAITLIAISFKQGLNLRADSRRMLLSNLFLIGCFFLFLYALIETGSRQPLLGVMVVLLIVLYRDYRKFLFFTLPILLIVLISFIDVNPILDGRIVSSILKILDTSALDEIRDVSIMSRVNYFIVGVTYIFDNDLMFGAGLNAFPGIYGSVTGKYGVAPHNDLLLLIVDFGYIGALIIVLPLIYAVVKSIKNKHIAQLIVFVLWAVGLSLNNVVYYYPILTSLIVLFYFNRNNDLHNKIKNI